MLQGRYTELPSTDDTLTEDAENGKLIELEFLYGFSFPFYTRSCRNISGIHTNLERF